MYMIHCGSESDMSDWLFADRIVFFFKQKTAYEMRISDWSSDVCSSDLRAEEIAPLRAAERRDHHAERARIVEAEEHRLAVGTDHAQEAAQVVTHCVQVGPRRGAQHDAPVRVPALDRKSTRLNSSH